MFVSSLAVYQWKKVIENCNSVGAGAHKVGTVVSWIFGECKKGKLQILKKVGLSTMKEILKKYVYNSTVMFFNILLFCLKGYSETLKTIPLRFFHVVYN